MFLESILLLDLVKCYVCCPVHRSGQPVFRVLYPDLLDMLYSISISSCGVLPIKRSAVSRLALVGNWSRRPTGKEEKGRKRENAMGTRS